MRPLAAGLNRKPSTARLRERVARVDSGFD
jgi:hypothetical protein